MSEPLSPPRQALKAWLLSKEGCPYVWGAKGENDAFDCSGLVTAGLVEMGYPTQCPKCGLGMLGYHGAQRLWDELKEPTAEDPLGPYDLCFYGSPGKATHVMFWVGDSTMRVYGASGGNQYTLNTKLAKRIGAQVQFKRTPFYRRDWRGFRKLPLP